MHLATNPTGWPFHNFQPPHQQLLLDQLYLFRSRWGRHEQIFSWTTVGEGQLPWYTKWLADQWPHWLQYRYNDDRDMPHDGTIKPRDQRYGEWAQDLKKNPPTVAQARATVDLDIQTGQHDYWSK